MPLVYRAVSEAEFQQIVRTGAFEVVAFGCEGKHFADTVAGAKRFGDALHGAGNYRIVEAETPEVAASLYCWPNLDGCGPCRFLRIDDLKDARPKPCEFESAP